MPIITLELLIPKIMKKKENFIRSTIIHLIKHPLCKMYLRFNQFLRLNGLSNNLKHTNLISNLYNMQLNLKQFNCNNNLLFKINKINYTVLLSNKYNNKLNRYLKVVQDW